MTSTTIKAFLGGILLLLFFAVGQAPAQTWTQLSPTGGPPPFRCYGATTVYDPATNRLILFGGRNCVVGSFNDVWVLTNADGTGGTPEWNLLSPTGSPPAARNNHTTVYDDVNNRMIVYSGCMVGCTPIANDVWVLANANGLGGTPTWTLLSTTGIPTGRGGHRASYDPLTNRMLMFGGQDGGGFLSTVFEQIGVLTNANGLEVDTPTWSLLSPTGAPASGTIGYYVGALVYDSAANRMTVFAGLPKTPPAVSTERNSVWTLDNANGLGGTPTLTNTVVQDAAGAPPSQQGGAFVSDTTNNIGVLYNFIGSPVAIARTWRLSHVNGLGGAPVWTEIFPGGGSPGSPHLNSHTYNATNNRMIVFTNSATLANTNEVWVLTDASGPLEVDLDIKPGNLLNTINPRSRGKIQVAILTDDTFDATTVDPTTVRFGASGTEAAPVLCKIKDAPKKDGDSDMVCSFRISETGIQCGDTSAALTGETFNGRTIQGSDAIKTVGCP